MEAVLEAGLGDTDLSRDLQREKKKVQLESQLFFCGNVLLCAEFLAKLYMQIIGGPKEKSDPSSRYLQRKSI